MGEVQFYLTSLNCDTRNLGQLIRLHWVGLKWVALDFRCHFF
ncbi:Transposase, IS4 [Richelia intracellularis]|nr:Transposase, IS4 [Richelia intracellularis]